MHLYPARASTALFLARSILREACPSATPQIARETGTRLRERCEEILVHRKKHCTNMVCRGSQKAGRISRGTKEREREREREGVSQQVV